MPDVSADVLAERGVVPEYVVTLPVLYIYISHTDRRGEYITVRVEVYIITTTFLWDK